MPVGDPVAPAAMLVEAPVEAPEDDRVVMPGAIRVAAAAVEVQQPPEDRVEPVLPVRPVPPAAGEMTKKNSRRALAHPAAAVAGHPLVDPLVPAERVAVVAPVELVARVAVAAPAVPADPPPTETGTPIVGVQGHAAPVREAGQRPARGIRMDPTAGPARRVGLVQAVAPLRAVDLLQAVALVVRVDPAAPAALPPTARRTQAEAVAADQVATVTRRETAIGLPPGARRAIRRQDR
ncbi:MAG TPA: hypothetical protein VGH31_12160, partial [Acidimicrobiales bacterium]